MGKRSRRIARDRLKTAEELDTRAEPRYGRREWYLYLFLFLTTFAVYSQVWHFEFVNFDDPEYVGENNHVRAGLTGDGLRWALTSHEAANWFPLTWVSHMADCQFFGLRSGWHHLTNVLLHVLATLLLFAGLKRMTGTCWRSALVAFLFALHPLHVESVAWVAERKDVLCAVFWCLTLWCYARYAEQPGVARYLAVLGAFCLGLMSKPMMVSLPFVLLLLDVWPLRRATRRAVLWEKIPFFALAAGVSLLTYLAQHAGRAVRPLGTLSAGTRVANALVAYVGYIGKTFWPADLAVYYPYVYDLAAWRVAAAGVVLVGISVVVARCFRTYPYLAVGWCWYLGTLVPVIGLVQVGGQASADRYTYLTTVGLAIMVSWGAADLVTRHPQMRTAVIAALAAGCFGCVVLTWKQTSYWADSGSLFQHAVEVTSNNYIAQNNLANY